MILRIATNGVKFRVEEQITVRPTQIPFIRTPEPMIEWKPLVHPLPWSPKTCLPSTGNDMWGPACGHIAEFNAESDARDFVRNLFGAAGVACIQAARWRPL